MMLRPPNPEPRLRLARCTFARIWLCGIALLTLLGEVHSETIVLHLKNGDRIVGAIVSEDTNRVVLSNTWIHNLSVPLAEITRRELVPGASGPATNAPNPRSAVAGTAAVPTNLPPVVIVAPAAASTNPPVVATAPPLPSAPVGTNAPAPAKLPPAIAKAVAPTAPKPKHWKAEARVGADFLFAATDQQIFYGAFKLTYELPYASNPKQFFRNIFGYTVNYGRTEGVLSANNMGATDKMDFDIGKQRFYLYNLAGAGYDEIRKIDFQWQAGPGVGYHLITKPAFVMNLETGIDYQEQIRSDNTTIEKFYFRLAEDVTWKLSKQITFVEKVAWSPQIEDLSQYRTRLEATLSYAFWQNFSFNVGLLNLYDTDPAKGVPNNDLQVRSSLGITF